MKQNMDVLSKRVNEIRETLDQSTIAKGGKLFSTFIFKQMIFWFGKNLKYFLVVQVS